MKFPGVAVEDLSLAIGAFQLSKLQFSLSAEEILVVLGPNGSGKSVILETIAGFYRPDAGRVFIGGRDVTLLPPERRRIGFLVQNFGLFPHMTVAQNVAVGVRASRGHAPDEANRQATFPILNSPALLARFKIDHLARRLPYELSPGEKQRTALARALASRPALFLFDEPFSALDAPTRDQLRDDLERFLRELAIPAIFVTHDYTDAMTLADRIVVLSNGEIVQSGSASDVFRRPATPFVAEFVGVENILAGRFLDAADGLLTILLGNKTLLASAPEFAVGPEREVRLCIRAEDVRLYPADQQRPTQSRHINQRFGRIFGIRTLGALCTVKVDCGFPVHACVFAREAREMRFIPGATVSLEIAADAIHVIPG